MAQKVILLCLFAVGCISAQLQCQHERDELAAGRNCERACRTDGTCRKQNRECICDGRCGPVCLRKTCPNLAQPGNGSVVFDPSGRFIGSEATYSCDNGFEVVGNAARICQANQTWGGTPPICQKFTGPLITVTGGQCERNDQEIQNQNRRCMRQCERDSDCLRGRPCVCDDICGLSCIPIDRTNYCEDLSSDQSVRVRITPNSRSFGSIAQYECRNGHNVVGGSNERKCLGSGQWSGDPLTCIPRVRCTRPPEVANSAHNGTKAYYVNGETVLYRCNFGYYRSGYLPLTRCNRDEWSELQFQCLPKSCGDPGHVLDGRRIGASFVFLGSVEYACNPGYELRGFSRRYCQADQQWSGSLPTCHPISCPDPGVPDDGFKIGSDYSYDEIVSYDCNTRYILEGQSSIRCQANATWSAPRPTCRLIQCRRPEEPRHGRSDADLEYYGQQGTIRFDCDRGYTLRGSSVITCNEREQWSPDPPLCLGQCRVPSCPSNGQWTVYNGGRYYNCRSNRMVDPGFRLTYNCENGYFKCQPIAPVCNDRVWEPPAQNLCVQGCRSVTLRASQLTASYTYRGTNECSHPMYHQRDTVIEYSCNRGYKIRDGYPSQATCRGRSWNPQQQPICEEVTCPNVEFPYGSVRYQQNGPFSSNRGHTATANFRCLEGYRLEGHTITCDNGIWNDTIPTCVEEPCSVVSVERYDMNIQYEVPLGSNEITAVLKPPGTTANFICRQYGFEASQTKRCERGSWRGIEPECLRIPCVHEHLENGDVTYTLNGVQYENPVHGVVRSYDCDAGYTVSDDGLSRCDAGRWTRRLSVCIERPCDINDLLSGDWNIMYNYLGGGDESAQVMKSPGTVATFTCNRIGYVTVGRNARTCRRGEWNGQNPLCERTMCPPVNLVNGIFEYLDTRNRTTWDPRHGDSVRVTCNRGYDLQGATQRRCWNGQWANGVPMCIEKPCNKDDLLVGEWDWEIQYTNVGGRDGSEEFASPGTVATLGCNTTGYETIGRGRRTCRQGEWGGRNPSCERIRCPTTQLDNGAFEYEDIDSRVTLDPKHGDLRKASCNRGYYLQGAEETQCWVGEWEGELPICVEEPCNIDGLPTGNWEIDFYYPAGTNEEAQLMKSASTEARFRCTLLGYVITEGETKTCRRGEWEGETPSCERSRCATFNLKNGRLEYQDSENVNISVPKHGDYIIATCNNGYHLQGQERTRCWNGEWEDQRPTCEDDPCRIFEEEALPNYLEVIYTAQNGSMISSRNGFFPGKSVANFTCRENGTRIKGNSQRTCKRGDWRGKFPECENDTCPTENIDNGRVTRDDIRPFTQEARQGDWRRFTCNLGYAIHGDERSQCIAGEWIPEKPTCIEAFCTIGTIANGVITRQDGSQFTEDARHGDFRRVTCDDGYTLNQPMWSECRSGQWSSANPTCVETPCPAVVNNGEYASILYVGRPSDAQSFPSGTTLEVDCAEGRVPEGPRLSFCRRGFWEPPRLLCVHTAPCQEVPAEEGRTIVYTDNTGTVKQHDSNLRVFCEGHMVRFGQNRSTCVNGAWSPPVAHCKENLALRKDAQQVNTDFLGEAGRAVDGIINGTYDDGSCSHTSRYGNNPWWYVDLGSSVLVKEIVIYNRQDGDNLHNRLLHANVRVGDQTSNVNLNSLAGTVNNTEINPIHIELTPAIEGRIVSVSELTAGNPLTLCEVQVFGEIRGCTSGCQVPHLQNGYFTIHRRTRLQPMACVSSGSDINVHCQEGLIREGGHYYRCQQSGEWSKLGGVDSTCQLCPSGNCVVPHIENGHYRNSPGGPPLGSGSCTSQRYLYVVCDYGMERDGSHFYHCSEGNLDTNNDGNVFTLCTTGASSERDQICPSPREENLVETFVGNDYAPLNEQGTFREGDFITSRCQNPKTQQFQGSVTRRCESGRWSGDPARCALNNFAISVVNTALQNVTENGTLIVYPVSGHVSIDCKLLNRFRGTINMYKDNVAVSAYPVGEGQNHKRLRIEDPSEANSGTYKCEFNQQSLSIVILFKDIRCPRPERPDRGTWFHQAANANPGGNLGHIFMESVALICSLGYRPSNSARPMCSYHGTWINMSHSCIRRY